MTLMVPNIGTSVLMGHWFISHLGLSGYYGFVFHIRWLGIHLGQGGVYPKLSLFTEVLVFSTIDFVVFTINWVTYTNYWVNTHSLVFVHQWHGEELTYERHVTFGLDKVSLVEMTFRYKCH